MFHLARRFFGHLGAAPLDHAAQDEVAARLSEAERRLFYAQSVADQRHAYETFRRVRVAGVPAEAVRLTERTALLHDVGKATARIGALGRSIATVLDVLHLPLWPAARAYRRHGPVGAGMLTRVGAEPLVVDFADRHPDPDPGPHAPEVWRALLAADHI